MKTIHYFGIILLLLSSVCFSQSKKELLEQIIEVSANNKKLIQEIDLLKLENKSLQLDNDSLKVIVVNLRIKNDELRANLIQAQSALDFSLAKSIAIKIKGEETSNTTTSPTNTGLKYSILKKQDISFGGKSKMVYRILINTNAIPSEKEMKNLAIRLWENGNKRWNDFTVFIYLPGMNTGSSAYGVGSFNEKGLINFFKNEYSLYDTKWESK